MNGKRRFVATFKISNARNTYIIFAIVSAHIIFKMTFTHTYSYEHTHTHAVLVHCRSTQVRTYVMFAEP